MDNNNNNDELRKAFEEAVKKRIIDKADNRTEHKYSPRFERRMRRITGMINGKIELMTNLPLRRFLSILAASVVAASFIALTAFGVKSVLKELFMSNFNTHTSIKMTDSDSSPGAIKDIYSLEVPEGFELQFESDNVINEKESYRCVYRNGNDYITFNQYAQTAYNSNVNTEENAVEYITINGHEGYVIEMGGSDCTVVWDNGDYIMELYANTDKSTAIEIANSVGKAE